MNKKYFLRNRLSSKYIKGTGIEIGPTYQPLTTLPGVRVVYVDIMSKEDLLATYPELKDKPTPEIDVIDDGEKLGKFRNSSLDFIVANHFIEHTIDPILTIANFLRCLKEDGIIFLAIPDKRATFDRDRPLTSIEHLVDVFEKGYDELLHAHYIEVVRIVEKKPEDQVQRRVDELIKSKFSIHYHTFQKENFVELIDHMRKSGFPLELLEIEDCQNGTDEFIAVLRKNKRVRHYGV